MLTSVISFTYKGFKDIRWALAQMKFIHPEMEDVSGLTFYKLLGSGAGNGFSIWPDFTTFVLMTVWESKEDLNTFREKHQRLNEMKLRSVSWGGAVLRPFKGHGTWNQKNPFEYGAAPVGDVPLAVLTRASIDRKKALRFWWRVPGVSKHIERMPGLLWAKGVGELPLVEQATLSFWRSSEELNQFAYKPGGKHQPMVKMTREVGWYTEEMFVRFEVLAWQGSFENLINQPSKN